VLQAATVQPPVDALRLLVEVDELLQEVPVDGGRGGIEAVANVGVPVSRSAALTAAFVEPLGWHPGT